MRIFLSFASEQEDEAERVAIALRNQGHKVFFSKDQVPGGTAYDQLIRNAVAESDLFIFLITPDSVKPGKYTRSELEYAHQKWPRAEGKILPVLVSPTPIDSIPNHLRAVAFLEPQGHIPADVAAHVAKLDTSRNHKSVIGFSLVGIATGLLCFLAIQSQFFAFTFSGGYGGGPSMIPAVIFAALVTACVYKFGARDKFILFVVLIMVSVAYALAFEGWALMGRSLGIARSDLFFYDITSVGSLLCYAAGGAIYSTVTVFAVALTNRQFLRADIVTPILIAGSLICCLIYLRESNLMGPSREANFLLAFFVTFPLFHSIVIGLIARGLARAQVA